jgi:predicted membrane protein
MNPRIGPLAIGMVVLYAVLAIGTSCCLFLHAEQQAHHHSPAQVAHSALCAWACQANPTTTIHSGVSLSVVFAVIALLRWYSPAPQTRLFSALIHSRGPPR